jgi:hypothetical protein
VKAAADLRHTVGGCLEAATSFQGWQHPHRYTVGEQLSTLAAAAALPNVLCGNAFPD